MTTRAGRMLAVAAGLAAPLVLAGYLLLPFGGQPVDTAFAAKPPTRTPAPTATRAPTATPAPTLPPSATPTTGPTATPVSGCSASPTTAAALTTALQGATPGSVICLAANTTYAGRFVATVSGTASSHIVLTGPATAILDGGSNSTGYGLQLDGASYWELRGFTV